PPASPGAHPPAPGARVRVPFGRRRLVGVIVASAETSELPPARLKPILEVLESRPVLDREALELLGWAAHYYHHPMGDGLARALRRVRAARHHRQRQDRSLPAPDRAGARAG